MHNQYSCKSEHFPLTRCFCFSSDSRRSPHPPTPPTLLGFSSSHQAKNNNVVVWINWSETVQMFMFCEFRVKFLWVFGGFCLFLVLKASLSSLVCPWILTRVFCDSLPVILNLVVLHIYKYIYLIMTEHIGNLMSSENNLEFRGL